MQVRNQSYLRKRNKETMLELLREKALSYSDIARSMQLSNPAITKIAEDLLKKGLICRNTDVKGRAGIKLSINKDYGYVFAVDFSKWKACFCVADFNCKIILKDYVDAIKLTEETLEYIIRRLKEWMAGDLLKAKKLRGIVLASPGKIDKKTGLFLHNPRFENLEFSMTEIFENNFDCPVMLKNDIKLALCGEKMFGKELKTVNDALMLHIDIGLGAALMLGGKVYEGQRGFAGEIGYFKINHALLGENHYQNMNLSNCFDSMSLYSMLNIVQRLIFEKNPSIIQKWLKEQSREWSDINIEDIIRAYNENDQLVEEVVDSSINVISSIVNDICEFLDIEKVVLIGSVVQFGSKYIKKINSRMKNVKVIFSSLQGNAPILGAIDQAVKMAMKESL